MPAGLAELINGANLWITDCKYSNDNYIGKKYGVQKLSWGHSYPEFIAFAAKQCGVKRIITTHYDPSSTDREIEMISDAVDGLSGISSKPAYEGMEIILA